MPPMVAAIGYRGDTRDAATLQSHGGFVPQFLLRPHQGGMDGFIACNNKTAGKIGCNCPGFTQLNLFDGARHRFIELMKKPIDLQAHVIFNRDGYISTALAISDKYGGHGYKVEAQMYEFAIDQAALRYRIDAKIPALVKNWRVYINAVNIGQATLIAMTPRGGAELTFITPVLYEHLHYLGLA
ncbi:MAG: hypothetical protein ACREP9_17160 [Candidatus Dormibacteraceae bacterium]